MRNHRPSNQKLAERVPWKLAVVFGLMSFFLVFALISGLLLWEESLQDDPDAGAKYTELEEEPGFYTVGTWAFIGTHFIDIRVRAISAYRNVEYSFNPIDEWVSVVPASLFHGTPLAVLLVMGYGFGYLNQHFVRSELDGTVFGASIVSGYLPVVLLFSIESDLRTATSEFMVSYTIPLVESALIAGIIYPVVFGGIGGYIAYSSN